MPRKTSPIGPEEVEFTRSRLDDLIQALAYAAIDDFDECMALMRGDTVGDTFATLEKGFTDFLSQLVSAKANLRDTLVRAEEANRAKAAFLAAVSHDVRTPLTAATGFVSLLQDGVYGAPTVAQREALARAEAAKKKSAEAGAGPSTAKEATADVRLTPEAKLLSDNFASNKNKLPWPVERGTIIRGFGKKAHPVYKNVQTNNNGVDISTTENAQVRAVFDGVVEKVFFTPVYQWGIIISHGDYFTIYYNLKEVSVKEKAKVSTKQRIGTAYTNPSSNNTEIHLEIWQNETLLNPSLWLTLN